MKLPDKETLSGIMEKGAEAASEASLDTVLSAKRVFDWKTKRIPGRMRRFFHQVTLAFEMLQDYQKGGYRQVPWRSVSMILAAVIYFLNPMDMVPDMIPGLGLIDDGLVLGAVFFALQSDLLSYCLFKNYEPADYF